jgi:hypothetical protein
MRALFVHGINTDEIPYNITGLNITWSNSWKSLISNFLSLDDLGVYNNNSLNNFPKSDFLYNYSFLNSKYSPFDLDNPNGKAINNYISSDFKNIVDYFFNQQNQPLKTNNLIANNVSSVLSNSITSITAIRPTNFTNDLQKKIGMEIQWLIHDQLKDQIAIDLINKLEEVNPDIIFAHSMGSFVCYYTFLNYQRLCNSDSQRIKIKNLIESLIFVTFGSQISYDFLMKYVWRTKKLNVLTKKWLNIWNDRDKFFNSSIYDVIPNYDSYKFKQLDVSFGLKNPKDFSEIFASFSDPVKNFHEATKYLSYLVDDTSSSSFINN